MTLKTPKLLNDEIRAELHKENLSPEELYQKLGHIQNAYIAFDPDYKTLMDKCNWMPQRLSAKWEYNEKGQYRSVENYRWWNDREYIGTFEDWGIGLKPPE